MPPDDPEPPSKPSSKAAVWISTTAAILSSTALLVQNGEHLWTTVFGSGKQNDEQTRTYEQIILGDWNHDVTSTNIKVTPYGDLIDDRLGRGRWSATSKDGGNF